MHSIERYGIVALLFLVVTVVAVLMWDGSKDMKKPKDVAGSGVIPSAAPARLDEQDAPRRLSLEAESQPGPLQRRPQRKTPVGRAGALNAAGEAQPLDTEPAPDARAGQPAGGPLPEGEAQVLESSAPREEPAREQVVGRAPAATHPYSVRPGDTLSEIAQRELGSSRRWQEIVAANPGLDPAKLHVGKTIQVPGARIPGAAAALAQTKTAQPKTAAAPSSEPAKNATGSDGRARATWKVGKGENMWRIAERSLGEGKRWREIAALNPGVNPDKLVLGQVLALPGSATPVKKGSTKAAAVPPKTKTAATLVASNVGAPRRGGKVK